jgi:zinc transporter, ZIP family
VNAYVVFVASLATAIATGLGTIPVAAAHMDETRSLGVSRAIAAGFMIGASVGLFYEGGREDVLAVLVGCIAGVYFIVLTKLLLERTQFDHIGQLRGARGMTALMVIGVMTVHSLTEGVALGVSFAGEQSLGVLIAIAIAIHNVPEGVAISLTLVPYGEKPWKAAGWSIFSSLPQPLMAVPAYLAVSTFRPLLAAGLGFAGGAMLWMVRTQLLPEIVGDPARSRNLAVLALSAGAMIGIEVAIGL